MADAEDVMPERFKVQNAIDHAPPADGEPRALIIPQAGGQGISQVKATVTSEHHPVNGRFGHPSR